jgi:hypothetical protein
MHLNNILSNEQLIINYREALKHEKTVGLQNTSNKKLTDAD